jgi:DNA (cytosine-5)-methyltransferase 1
VAPTFTFLEFFAGGGFAGAGLGPKWRGLFANDIDGDKCAAYRRNFGADALREGDIAQLELADLPATRADLSWASFPCQDLSLAGARRGLKGERSGLFFSFWRLMEALADAGRGPRLIVIENVVGLLTSNAGEDFAAIIGALSSRGYCAAALILNASGFAPQSRPRLFVFGFAPDVGAAFAARPAESDIAPAALQRAVDLLPQRVAKSFRWLDVRAPAGRNLSLADIVDWEHRDWSLEKGERALSLMSPRQRARVAHLHAAGGRHVGAAFYRVRREGGARVQRFEARFDGLAGCLRTPAGGSSRQWLLKIENGGVEARLLSPAEGARLMGLPDDYRLPARSNAALKLLGDGVAPPVVRWIAAEILEPALARRRAAA